MTENNRSGLIIGACVVGLGLSYFLTQRYHTKIADQKKMEKLQAKRGSHHGPSHIVSDGKDVKASFITEQDVRQGVTVPQPRVENEQSVHLEVHNPREVLRKQNPNLRYDPHDTSVHAKFGQFDPSMLRERVASFWARKNSEFGHENLFSHFVLNEILTDRYILVHGFQLIRDELQFAGFQEHDHETGQEINNCGADCKLPSVVSTLAYTNCGDRFNSEVHACYKDMVGTRFSTISELGSLKTEAFYPTGGGTDDGKTFAHVTVAHMLNDNLKKVIYEGNSSSYSLVNFDIFTHCGKSSDASHVVVGVASESEWRDQRAACGAIVGCLKAFDSNNPVHKRLRSDLGEDNFEVLSKQIILCDNGTTKINYLVAAAIIAIQGMRNTAKACVKELDERGLAHLTASVALNKKSTSHGLFNLYLGRATVFEKCITIQSFGTDATKYSGILVRDGTKNRIQLFYDGKLDLPVEVVEKSALAKGNF